MKNQGKWIWEWQSRRFVLTKTAIHLAFQGEELEIDHIPLAEINLVNMMKNSDIALELSEDDTQGGEVSNAIHISTEMGGHNSGRDYYLHIDSKDLEGIIKPLKTFCREARKRRDNHNIFQRAQKKVRQIYESVPSQALIVLLIALNFVFTIVETQIAARSLDGQSPDSKLLLHRLGVFFVFVFVAELAVNAFARWYRPWAANPWNWFDAFIVAVSIAITSDSSASDSILTSLQAIGVLRALGRVPALRKVVSALAIALLPVFSVFLILVLIICIGALVAVSLFGRVAPDFFGGFEMAFFTLLLVTAGEPWPEALPRLEEDGTANWTVMVFCGCYIMLSTWLILQVSFTVLLSRYIGAFAELEEEGQGHQGHSGGQVKNPLEPLLLKLAREFTDDQDLSERLQRLYKVLDSDKSGGLESSEFCAAIKKLDFTPRIHVTASDFASFTQNGTLCDAEGQLGPLEFEHVMRHHIRQLTQSRLAMPGDGGLPATPEEDEFTHRSALKVVLMEQTRAESTLDTVRTAVERIAAAVCGEPEAAQEEQRGPLRLEVTVLRANHLPKMDTFGSIDPFCEVRLGSASFTTGVRKNTYCPEWGESFVLDPPVGGGSEPLRVTLMDWDLVGDNDCVGVAELPVEQIAAALACGPGWERDETLPVRGDDGTPVLGKDREVAVVSIRLRVVQGAVLQSPAAKNSRPAARAPAQFLGIKSLAGLGAAGAAAGPQRWESAKRRFRTGVSSEGSARSLRSSFDDLHTVHEGDEYETGGQENEVPPVEQNGPGRRKARCSGSAIENHEQGPDAHDAEEPELSGTQKQQQLSDKIQAASAVEGPGGRAVVATAVLAAEVAVALEGVVRREVERLAAEVFGTVGGTVEALRREMADLRAYFTRPETNFSRRADIDAAQSPLPHPQSMCRFPVSLPTPKEMCTHTPDPTGPGNVYIPLSAAARGPGTVPGAGSDIWYAPCLRSNSLESSPVWEGGKVLSAHAIAPDSVSRNVEELDCLLAQMGVASDTALMSARLCGSSPDRCRSSKQLTTSLVPGESNALLCESLLKNQCISLSGAATGRQSNRVLRKKSGDGLLLANSTWLSSSKAVVENGLTQSWGPAHSTYAGSLTVAEPEPHGNDLLRKDTTCIQKTESGLFPSSLARDENLLLPWPATGVGCRENLLSTCASDSVEADHDLHGHKQSSRDLNKLCSIDAGLLSTSSVQADNFQLPWPIDTGRWEPVPAVCPGAVALSLEPLSEAAWRVGCRPGFQ